ncbi:MAG: DNA-binding protein [Geobacter sp.]|nr:MAG: DNA-binding protein [Geobacter sp.]
MKPRTRSFTAFLAIFLVAALAATAFAGPWRGWRGSGGWGTGGAYQRMYNAATVETISGEVVSIDRITPTKGMSYGIHVMLKTDKETIPVHLGPAWYVERLDTKINKGDTVMVKGSRITYNGKPAIIADEVKKGDAVLKLRDENGYPAWAGWRR